MPDLGVLREWVFLRVHLSHRRFHSGTKQIPICISTYSGPDERPGLSARWRWKERKELYEATRFQLPERKPHASVNVSCTASLYVTIQAYRMGYGRVDLPVSRARDLCAYCLWLNHVPDIRPDTRSLQRRGQRDCTHRDSLSGRAERKRVRDAMQLPMDNRQALLM